MKQKINKILIQRFLNSSQRRGLVLYGKVLTQKQKVLTQKQMKPSIDNKVMKLDSRERFDPKATPHPLRTQYLY